MIRLQDKRPISFSCDVLFVGIIYNSVHKQLLTILFSKVVALLQQYHKIKYTTVYNAINKADVGIIHSNK